MIDNKNKSAYPVVEHNRVGSDTLVLECTEAGLTKREYFAAKAMQGFISNSTFYQGYSSHADTALQAVSMADALLNELSK